MLFVHIDFNLLFFSITLKRFYGTLEMTSLNILLKASVSIERNLSIFVEVARNHYRDHSVDKSGLFHQMFYTFSHMLEDNSEMFF